VRTHQGKQRRNDPDENGLAFHILRARALGLSPDSKQVIGLNLFFNEIDGFGPPLGTIKCIQTTYWVYQISPHLEGLYNPELEGKGASTWSTKVRETLRPKDCDGER